MNRRGSCIAEAALVLPVIMMTVITAVLIVMFFYTQVREQSLMHMALRERAGILSSKTLVLESRGWDGRTGMRGGCVTAGKDLIMDHRGVLRKEGMFTVEDSIHVVDGTTYVRQVRGLMR